MIHYCRDYFKIHFNNTSNSKMETCCESLVKHLIIYINIIFALFGLILIEAKEYIFNIF